MTGIDEDGKHPLCPHCLGRIEQHERGVSHYDDIYHADCFKDKYGNESAMDEFEVRQMIHRAKDEARERAERMELIENFDKRGPNTHGGRRLA